MPKTVITAGMSVKNPGPQEYSSVGHSLSLAVELDSVEDADHARSAVQTLFAEVRDMLNEQVASQSPSPARTASRHDLWGGSGGNDGNGRKPASRPAQSGGKGDRAKPDPISNKQAKFLFQLARRAGMRTQPEVGAWLRDKLGVDRGVYELSKVEASRAIDILNSNGNGGNGK